MALNDILLPGQASGKWGPGQSRPGHNVTQIIAIISIFEAISIDIFSRHRSIL